jgi:hypothetical protein
MRKRRQLVSHAIAADYGSRLRNVPIQESGTASGQPASEEAAPKIQA